MSSKTGRTFPNDAKAPQSPYVEAISAALREKLGDTRQGTKIAMRWIKALVEVQGKLAEALESVDLKI